MQSTPVWVFAWPELRSTSAHAGVSSERSVHDIHQQAPDLILLNGRFTTLDKSKPTVTVVAIKDGKFIAVGDDSEISQLKSDGTRTVDL